MPLRSPSAFEHRLAEHDADVLDGVVLVDVEIAGRLQRQIEAAVAREQLQHVIEETDAGADVVAAAAVDRQRPLICVSVVSPIERRCSAHRCLAATTDSSASIAASVCSIMPAVIRMHPGVAGSFERSRTWISACGQRLHDERRGVADPHEHVVGGALPVRAAPGGGTPRRAARAIRVTCAA